MAKTKSQRTLPTPPSKSDLAKGDGIIPMPNPLTYGISPPKSVTNTEVYQGQTPSPDFKPTGEQTARQDSLFNGMPMCGIPGMLGLAPAAFYGSAGWGLDSGMPSPFYSGFGSIALNGFGVPLGSFGNYWLMERNPTVALAEAVADAPIRSAQISYASRKDTPQEIVDFVRGNFGGREAELLDIFSYARAWGFRPAELVFKYGQISGKLEFEKAKPLMPELTMALRDIHGNLVGLENQGTRITDSRQYLWMTYDGKGCNPYGRSRKENCKKPWLREEALYDMMEYSMNITVRPFGYVTYPYGLEDASGGSLNDAMKKNATQIAQQMASGQWATVPNPYAKWMEEMVQKGINPKDVMPYDINWYDAKSDGGAGFERMFQITSRGIVMGILQPARTILEGPGSQADASQHTDTAMLIPQQFLGKICRKVSCGPIDTVVTQNFGEEYRGSVWWEPAPLVNRQLVFNNDLVRQVLGDTKMGPALMKHVVNLASIFETAGVKIDKFDQQEIIDLVEEEQEKEQDALLSQAQAGKNADQPNGRVGKSQGKGRKANKNNAQGGDTYKKKGKEVVRASLEVTSTETLTKEEEKRRKALLLALLAYFMWQQESLITHPSTAADAPLFNEKLADVLATGMKRPGALDAERQIEEQAFKIAKQINATTFKNIETGGKFAPAHVLPPGVDQATGAAEARAAMIRRVMGKSMEIRATVIEDDVTFLAGEIIKAVEAMKIKARLIWRTAHDEMVCSTCGPLDGVTVEAGKEFAPGIRYPVVDTHSNCRCFAEVVPPIS